MKSLLLISLLFISGLVSAQNFKTAFDQLVYVNEEWSNLKDVEASLKVNAAKPLSEEQLIQFHLQETEKLLRKKKVPALSAAQQKQRLTNLNKLHNYLVKGDFPVNDGHQNRQPYFIDKYNTYCAVGYLMQQSGGDAMARNIHETQNYSYLFDINHPQLMRWANESGLSLDELALIQPGYGNPTPSFVNEFHYNNAGNDVNEYIEVHRDDCFTTRTCLDSIIFYNASGNVYKRMTPSEMQSTSYDNNLFLYYAFPTTDTFADVGRLELKGHLYYSAPTFLIQTIIYNTDSVIVMTYPLQYTTPTPPPPTIRIYNVSENEATPLGTSLTFCGTPQYPVPSNLTLQSMLATPGTISCLTLPISLGNFSYTPVNKTIRLNWETLSESNTKYFAIERSSDGTNFTTIGNTNAAGNSSDKKTYSFTDNNPRYINHYRIRQVDADGKYSYTKMLFVKMLQANPLEVMSNVVKEQLKVSIHLSQADIASFKLYDFSGKLVKQYKGLEGTQILDVGNLSSGSYLLQLVTTGGQVYNQRLVR